jgi:hypothetical protein
MPFEIKHGSDIADACVAVLYQGRSKTRKTSCAVTWPDPLIISVDPNRAPLARYPDAQVIVNPDVAVIENEILPALKAGKIDAKTVVLDSFSFLSNKWADRIMGARTSYGQGQGQAAGVSLRRFLQQIVELKSLPRPYNVVVTVHEALSGGDEGPKRIEPITIGALRESMGAAFDLIVLTEMENVLFKDAKTGQSAITAMSKGRTVSPDPNRTAGGSLWGRLMPPTIDNPTYQNLRRAVGLPVDFEPRMTNQQTTENTDE